MINYILGGSGTGKSVVLMEKIRHEVSDSKTVFTIVPEQFSFEFDRKLYEFLGAVDFNKVRTLTFTTLSRDIFLEMGGKSGEYADEMTKTLLMYQAVCEMNDKHGFLYFAKQSKSSGFIEMALQTVAEFRNSCITPDMIFTNAMDTDSEKSAQKLWEIAELCSIYDRLLKEYGLKDSLCNITEAASIANACDYFKEKTLFIDEFESFTSDEIDMLDVIIADTDNFYISLRTDDIKLDAFSRFATVNKTFSAIETIAKKYNLERDIDKMSKNMRFSNDAVLQVESNILCSEKSPEPIESNGFVKTIESKNIYDELEFVCAEIRRLVIEDGYSYNEIAVVTRAVTDYSGMVDSVFSRYKIPYFLNIKKSAMHSSIMTFASAALEIASVKTPETELVFRYAKTQLTHITIEEISLLENYCYMWGISGKMLFSPFKVGESEYMEELRQKLVTPLISLRKKCENASGFDISKALYEFIDETGVAVHAADLMHEYKDYGFETDAREMKMLWVSLMDMLDVMANTLGERKISAEDYKNIFLTMLRQNKYSVPPQKLDAVTIAPAQTARLNSPKAVFVLGVNEGIFPSAEKPSGLFSDEDKELFKHYGINISRMIDDMISDENLAVYKTLSAPSERLYISYALSDNSGQSRTASSVVSQTEALFSDDIRVYADKMPAKFYASTISSAYYTLVQNFNKNDKEYHILKNIISSDERYKEKLEFLEKAALSSDFKIEDTGIVDKLFTKKLMLSATKFESYNSCHFQFFCQNGLNIYPRVKKDINAVEKGILIHECLEKFISSCESKEQFVKISRTDIEKTVIHIAEIYKENELGSDYGKTQRFIANFNKIVSGITDLIVHIQNEFKQSKFVPVNFELKIGKGGAEPIRLTTPDGIEVILTGKVDRVDIFDDGHEKYIRIIDYKTGKKNFSLGKLFYGLDMQMLLYLFALTEENGMYADCKPSGVLYMPSGGLKCTGKREGTQDIDGKINSQYKMSGIVLNSRCVLSAMEEAVSGVFIPAKIASKDSSSGDVTFNEKASSYLNSAQFENLRKYAKNLMCDMSDMLYSGNISASPLIGKESDPCRFCSYSEICGNDGMTNIREFANDDRKIALMQILDKTEEE